MEKVNKRRQDLLSIYCLTTLPRQPRDICHVCQRAECPAVDLCRVQPIAPATHLGNSIPGRKQVLICRIKFYGHCRRREAMYQGLNGCCTYASLLKHELFQRQSRVLGRVALPIQYLLSDVISLLVCSQTEIISNVTSLTQHNPCQRPTIALHQPTTLRNSSA